MQPYERLANAIVEKSVEDWILGVKALRRAKKRGVKKNNRTWMCYEKLVRDCERFFLGDWIKALTNVDGKTILKKLKEKEGIPVDKDTIDMIYYIW